MFFLYSAYVLKLKFKVEFKFKLNSTDQKGQKYQYGTLRMSILKLLVLQGENDGEYRLNSDNEPLGILIFVFCGN